MKVLIQTRTDYRQNQAGDTIQVLGTVQGLQKQAVKVYISPDPKIRLSEFDLIHLFNVTRVSSISSFFENAKRQNKPIILSPVYWDMQDYLKNSSDHSGQLMDWESHQAWRGQLMKDCDLLLPNGQIEMDRIKEQFKVDIPYQVIPNGFPEEYLGIDASYFREKYPDIPEKFILSIARISPRKNQLKLAKACYELDLPLVLAGAINDKIYFEKIKEYPNVIFLGILQGRLLASAYAAAKVHALPSWFETPGLSSLEAGACGCVILSTDQGSTKEYFKDMASYVNPFDENSIVPALEKALISSPEPLTKHIQSNFTWSKIGEMTYSAYKKLLK